MRSLFLGEIVKIRLFQCVIDGIPPVSVAVPPAFLPHADPPEAEQLVDVVCPMILRLGVKDNPVIAGRK